MASWADLNLPAPLYLRLSLGRCRGCSSRERPARAASCCSGCRTSVSPRVRGGSSGGPAAPQGAACLPRTQAAREARAAVSGPPTSPWLAPSHCVHSTPQRPDDASHACARLWLPHPTDVHEQGCAHSALDGVSPCPGVLLWLALQVACPPLQDYFRKSAHFHEWFGKFKPGMAEVQSAAHVNTMCVPASQCGDCQALSWMKR